MDLKRTVSISCLAGATALLLAFMVFPHHHHYRGMVCYVMERCEQDGDINDKHTFHHVNDTNHHDDDCITEINYIVPPAYNDIRCKVFSCNNDHCLIHLFPVSCFPMNSDICSIDLLAVKYGYGEVVSFYKSTDASQSHGLRAPPSFLLL